MKSLLSGNEALARGAWEAGVTVATGYPGTPSTEILENVVKYKEDIYCEWSPNEKVAFEVAAGASLAGARVIVTMKHVGLNVAADPLMTLSYTGVVGGMVICVADDPGMHSSQNEQDTRHFARFAKIPVFEPSDSAEACRYMAVAIAVSEEFRTPVIMRTTTRVSHSRGLVELGGRKMPERPIGFEKDPQRFVPIPLWGRGMRVRVEERLKALGTAASASEANKIEEGSKELGIITSSIAYQYVKEVFPEASILKLGWAYPFPDELIKRFAGSVEKLLVVEELEDILEEHIKAIGIPCIGKEIVPGISELSLDKVKEIRARYYGTELPAAPANPLASDLPARPPVLCPGCPHRGIFAALGKFDVVVTGDIGCYSLGVFPPLSRIDTILCMGGGISMAQGFEKAGEKKKVVGMVGDSTFFHSGITGLLDIAYNKGTSTLIVLDNRTTAMTGHQDNPGTGKTLMGEPTQSVSIQEIGRACGLKRVYTVNPYRLNETVKIIGEALESDEPTLIVSAAPCPLNMRAVVGPSRSIDCSKCRKCSLCLKLGCPAIEKREGQPEINPLLCIGCGLCEQVCKFEAVGNREVEA